MDVAYQAKKIRHNHELRFCATTKSPDDKVSTRTTVKARGYEFGAIHKGYPIFCAIFDLPIFPLLNFVL